MSNVCAPLNSSRESLQKETTFSLPSSFRLSFSGHELCGDQKVNPRDGHFSRSSASEKLAFENERSYIVIGQKI